ncbi:predicted protein [Chaetoceros tenuissimus]|uniref:Uncharacterized protein n=1 Tax=Chaetoceros tenuissimus TaxID=426638 RepID=A0AAD3HCY5_9STRA|nr:predicted protein [Chaetoceros tenuissimus]
MNTSNHDPFLPVHQKMLLHGESPLLSQRRGRRQSEKIESVSNSFMTDDQVRGSKSHGALAEYFSRRKARRQTISFGGGESKQDGFGFISPDLHSGDALFREVRNKTYSKQAHSSNENKGVPRRKSFERNRALRRGQDNSAQSVVNGGHKRASNPENNRRRRPRRNSIMLQNRHAKVEPNTRTESGRDQNLSLRGTVSEGQISNSMRNVLSNHNVQDEQNAKWESEGRYGSSSVEKRVSGNDGKLLQDNAKQIRSIMNLIAFESLPDMRMMRDKASRRTKTAANSKFKLERKSKQSRGGINPIVAKDCRDKRQGTHMSSKVKPRKAPE